MQGEKLQGLSPPREPGGEVRRPKAFEANLSYRQVMVGRFLTGLVGLDEIFAELSEAGEAPDPALGPELVRRVADHNYITPGSEGEFAEALLREYRRYWQRKTGQGPARPVRQAPQTWQGHLRHEIPWYPTLYTDRCDGCGDCVTFCHYGVFEQAESRGVVQVVAPFNCLVGCEACAKVCPHGAIRFPPRSLLSAFHG